MALPSSGSITIAMIATELGVGLPLSLTDTNVRALAGKATGNVVLPTDFYGKSSYDPNPNAINWADCSDYNFGTAAAATSATITGINTTITLRLTLTTGSAVRRRLLVYVGGANVISTVAVQSTYDFTVTNGQAVQFNFEATQQYSPKQLSTIWNGTATVTNLTTGVDLDTFAYNVTAEAEEL